VRVHLARAALAQRRLERMTRSNDDRRPFGHPLRRPARRAASCRLSHGPRGPVCPALLGTRGRSGHRVVPARKVDAYGERVSRPGRYGSKP
jgi:hypothetical protein